jgi:hypothetical protein
MEVGPGWQKGCFTVALLTFMVALLADVMRPKVVTAGGAAEPPAWSTSTPNTTDGDGTSTGGEDITMITDEVKTAAPRSNASTASILTMLQHSSAGFIKSVTKRAPSREWCALDNSLTTAAVDEKESCVQTWENTAAGGITRRCGANFTAMEGCPLEPNRLGNLSRVGELRAFEHYPALLPSMRTWRSVTTAQRRAYWAYSPDPFDQRCATCQHSLAHASMLYSARRWWAVPYWQTYTADTLSGQKARHTVLGLTESALVGTSFDIMMDSKAPPTTEWLTVPLRHVQRLVFCMPTSPLQNLTGDEPAFVAIKVDSAKEAATVHVLRFIFSAGGARCLWRSLQLLFLDGSGERVDFGNGVQVGVELMKPTAACKVSDEAAIVRAMLARNGGATNAATERLPPDNELPYLPCFRTMIGDLQKRAVNEGMTNPVYKNFWPTKCDAAYDGDECPGAPVAPPTLAAQSPPHKLRVAVTLSGFVRSFSFTREHIFRNIIQPHDADLYGFTWNVIGRVKKMKPIPPKMIVSVGRMHGMVYDLLRGVVPPEVNETRFKDKYRYEVWDYRKYVKYHNILFRNGYHHVSMYHQLVRSVQLVMQSGREYDIVIRSRWDIYQAVPLRFTPLAPGEANEAARYALDVGVHCRMEGAWFPRHLVVEEGKFLRHHADTRFKLFAWQVCDYIDIAPYKTMAKLADLMNWIKRNNVFSGAQFVEHAFFIDQGVSYQPAQLFTCIQRHKDKFFC